MRIDPNTRIQQAGQEGTNAGASAEAAAATRGGSNASGSLADDTAQLSTDPVRVQSLAAQVNSLPEIRQEKVSALGQAVRDGSYQVSPEQTAEAVMSEMVARSFAA